MLLKYDPLACLPSAEDLPDSDDTPVDNERGVQLFNLSNLKDLDQCLMVD
jgi:hypothetical protein